MNILTVVMTELITEKRTSLRVKPKSQKHKRSNLYKVFANLLGNTETHWDCHASFPYLFIHARNEIPVTLAYPESHKDLKQDILSRDSRHPPRRTRARITNREIDQYFYTNKYPYSRHDRRNDVNSLWKHCPPCRGIARFLNILKQGLGGIKSIPLFGNIPIPPTSIL